MLLFKYTKAEFALKTLRQKRLKVSAANVLNDPFELSPVSDPLFYTLERAVDFLKQPHEIGRWYKIEAHKIGIEDYGKYKNWYLDSKNIQQRAKSLLPNVPKNSEQACLQMANTISQMFRLFCASKIRDSILMWSHYADEHRGVVLGLESNEAPFKFIPKYLLPVRYSKKKTVFNFLPSPQYFEKQLFRVVRTKSIHWKYEREIRFVAPLTRCIDGQFLDIEPAAIRSLTFGCRCSKDDPYRMAIEVELQKPEFSHIDIWQTQQSSKSFQLEFQKTSVGKQSSPSENS
jgi:hypothetical protein